MGSESCGNATSSAVATRLQISDCKLQIGDYCRSVEAYLCQKNDGHLIRVVGPSFELVSRWEADGVPLQIARSGIDRYFERYYRRGPRRRPVRIDFCDADVRDIFDEWRRAIGLPARRHQESIGPQGEADSLARVDTEEEARRGASLPAHLERATRRLTNARAKGTLGAEADSFIDRLSSELDAARASAQGVRGEARRSLVTRLAELDAELVKVARGSLDNAQRRAFEREADEALADFRDRMSGGAYRRAREAAVDRLTRERLGLPTLSFI